MSDFEDLMPKAAQIAAYGPIMPAGRWAYRGAAAAVADLPPAARPGAIWMALSRLAEEDPQAALHGLAQMLRIRTDTAIRAGSDVMPSDRFLRRRSAA